MHTTNPRLVRMEAHYILLSVALLVETVTGLLTVLPATLHGYCDCDTVDSTTLQVPYSVVAAGGNATTSPTSLSLSSGAITAEYSPHHL